MREEPSEKLLAFIAAAQEQALIVVKDREARDPVSGKTLYHFATLTSVWELLRPVLREHKVTVLQPVGGMIQFGDQLVVRIDTVLLDPDGKSYHSEADVPIPAGTKLMSITQRWGSAITYGRRYALCSMLGILAGDDEDARRLMGAEASGGAPSAGAAPGRNWFAMYEDDSWRRENLQGGDAWDFLGEMSPSELVRAIKSEANSENPSPALHAAAAAWLVKGMATRNITLADLMSQSKWTGPATLQELSLKDIVALQTALAAIPKSK